MIASAGASLAGIKGARQLSRLSLLSRFCRKVELISDKLDLSAESGMIHVACRTLRSNALKCKEVIFFS